MEILCIGLSSYDVTYPLDSYIKENTKVRTKNRVECGGGQANNIAYSIGEDEEDYEELKVAEDSEEYSYE